MARRVVITGVGIVTAHGTGYEANLEGMRSGKDSISLIKAFDVSVYRGKTGGEAKGFSFDMPLKTLRRDRLDRSSQLLLTVVEEARRQAGITLDGTLAQVFLGTTLGGMISGTRYHADYIRKGGGLARPSLLTDYLAHFQGEHLMEEYGINGSAMTLSDACASGANAIGYAFHSIRDGLTDVAIAGGYDPMCEFTFAGFNSLQAVTPTLCRPFDSRRDGLVLGEGAAVLIMEELGSAIRRGANILGEVVGFGASSDAYHSTRPDPDARGAISAIRAALDDACIWASDIDYINAHGTATHYNDLMEAKAINSVFGKRAVPVSSVKPMIGHLLGAAGAVEAVVSLMAINEGFIPQNLNCESVDPACRINVVREPAPRASIKRVLSNSFGFGGANASLVLQGF